MLQLCKLTFPMRLQVSDDKIKVISLESAELKGLRNRTDMRDLHSSPLKLWDFVQQPANRIVIWLSQVNQDFLNLLMTRTPFYVHYFKKKYKKNSKQQKKNWLK